jgi:hypothetical protein
VRAWVPEIFQISLAAFISERVFTTLNHATGAAAAGQLIRLRSHMRYEDDQIKLTGHDTPALLIRVL